MKTGLEAEIEGLLQRCEPQMADLAQQVITALREIRPDLLPQVRLGWGSVNFRHPEAGFVCAVFPMRDHVSLVFEHGRQLSHPLLQGAGKQVRFVRLLPGEPVPVDDLGLLLAEAIALRS